MIAAELTLSAAEASRLGVPGGMRDRQRHRHPPDDHPGDDQHSDAPALACPPLPHRRQPNPRTLTIVATDVNGASTTATKDITLRR
jgi:hypothetical protein